MRVLAFVHLYPPEHNAGAERMLHELLADSVARGHTVMVIAARATPGDPYLLDGVTIWPGPPSKGQTRPAFAAADVVVTHLDVTRQTVGWARDVGRPVVHLLHNHRQLAYHRVRPSEAAAVVANSQWIARLVPARYGPVDVVHPPVDLDRYRPVEGPHDRVVLMNLMRDKGAGLFYDLASRMPDVGFLGVRGAYGHQEIPDRLPANVEVIGNTADVVADVYARARVVLVPSVYESWGRVAIEASAGGIPVVYAPTDGLCESMGPGLGAGVAVRRGDVDGWERWARTLVESAAVRGVFAARGRLRAEQLDPRQPGGAFDRWATVLDRFANG